MNVSNPAQNPEPCPVIVQLSETNAISGESRKGEIEWNRIVLLFVGSWLPLGNFSERCWRCSNREPRKFDRKGYARFAG